MPKKGECLDTFDAHCRLLDEQPKNLQGSRRLMIGPIGTCDGFGFFFFKNKGRVELEQFQIFSCFLALKF